MLLALTVIVNVVIVGVVVVAESSVVGVTEVDNRAKMQPTGPKYPIDRPSDLSPKDDKSNGKTKMSI